MEDSTEKDILEEITEGGLPSNVTADVVRDAPPVELEPAAAPVAVDAEAGFCGEVYTFKGQVFPDVRCQLPKLHPPRSGTANHYAGAIGWWQ